MRKGADIGADGLIFDLEDALPDEKKSIGRDNINTVLTDTDFGTKRISVRINPVESEYWIDDLLALNDVSIDSISVPKIETSNDIRTVVQVLTTVSKNPPTVGIGLESPQAIFSGHEIAQTCREIPQVTSLGIGVADYARVIGAPEVSNPIREFLSHLQIAYAAIGNLRTGLPPYFNIGDLDGLRAEAERGRALGFTGMTAIHPEQVPIINDVFSPTDEEIEQARMLVNAFESADKDSIVVDDVFLDTAIVERYKTLLDQASSQK